MVVFVDPRGKTLAPKNCGSPWRTRPSQRPYQTTRAHWQGPAGGNAGRVGPSRHRSPKPPASPPAWCPARRIKSSRFRH